MEGKTIAELRREKGMSQRQLAEALGFATSTVGMWELGLRTPNLQIAKKIARFFKVPLEAIYFGEEVRKMRQKKEVS